MRSLLNPLYKDKQQQQAAIRLYQLCEEGNDKGACQQLNTTGFGNYLSKPAVQNSMGFSEGGEALLSPEQEVEEVGEFDALFSVFSPEEQAELAEALSNYPIVSKLAYMAYKNGDGEVSGAGTSTSDEVPARLSDGEFVLNKAAVDMIGLDKLEAINEEALRKSASM